MARRQVSEADLLRWSEALAGVARTGLGFTDSLYERERFEEILHVAADIRLAAESDEADSDEERNGPADLVDGWLDSVGHGVTGYVTPKVAVGAVVGNERRQILLIQRSDSGAWLYPTGWADVGYSASEVVVKEIREETGIDAVPVRVIAVLDGLRLGARGLPFYSVVFYCRAVGGVIDPHPLEARNAGWFAEDDLPSPLAGAERWKELAFAAIRGETRDVMFDAPRHPAWRRE